MPFGKKKEGIYVASFHLRTSHQQWWARWFGSQVSDDWNFPVAPGSWKKIRGIQGFFLEFLIASMVSESNHCKQRLSRPQILQTGMRRARVEILSTELESSTERSPTQTISSQDPNSTMANMYNIHFCTLSFCGRCWHVCNRKNHHSTSQAGLQFPKETKENAKAEWRHGK